MVQDWTQFNEGDTLTIPKRGRSVHDGLHVRHRRGLTNPIKIAQNESAKNILKAIETAINTAGLTVSFSTPAGGSDNEAELLGITADPVLRTERRQRPGWRRGNAQRASRANFHPGYESPQPPAKLRTKDGCRDQSGLWTGRPRARTTFDFDHVVQPTFTGLATIDRESAGD